jgi:hypothetical protein
LDDFFLLGYYFSRLFLKVLHRQPLINVCRMLSAEIPLKAMSCVCDWFFFYLFKYVFWVICSLEILVKRQDSKYNQTRDLIH